MPTPAEYQKLIEGGCPWCGEGLVIKSGKRGEFIACSEWCGYTKSVPGRSYSIPKREKCRYKKCDGSGLIPFKRSDGTIVPAAWTHCDCHSVYGIGAQEHFIDVQPSDFDFPMSGAFRAHTYNHCNQPDPGYVVPTSEPEKPVVQEIIHRDAAMGKDEFALLQRTAGEVKYLRDKLNERSVKKEYSEGRQGKVKPRFSPGV